MKKKYFILLFVMYHINCIFGEPSLEVSVNDLRIIPESTSMPPTFDNTIGYHLYIRKKEGMESVMLTESTASEGNGESNYAYRALEFNGINGNEIRYLDGKPIKNDYTKYSLIDSTPESHKDFGEAFHIYIPRQVQYGNPWSRNGKITIGKGTFINIRTFSRKYGDYEGSFKDNPYKFDLGNKETYKEEPKTPSPLNSSEPTQKLIYSLPSLTIDNYNERALEDFLSISETTTISSGPETIVKDINKIIKKITPKDNVELVFVIDATGSMKDDIEELRKNFISTLLESTKGFKKLKIGMVFYRDYSDNFKFHELPIRFYDFTDRLEVIKANLNGFMIQGTEGGDIPEAVYEGLYGATNFFKWSDDSTKRIILIGDAEPHHSPRGGGKYSKDFVMNLISAKNIVINSIITPDPSKKSTESKL